MVDQREVFFVNLTLFLPNVMTFFLKISVIDNIFRNSVKKILNLTKNLTFYLPHGKVECSRSPCEFKKKICGKSKNSG